MATSFKKTFVKTFPKVGEKVTSDTVYWKNLETPVTKKEYGAISHIEFSPVSPHQLAVTSSTRIQIYSSSSLQIHRTLSRFKNLAYGGSFRSDGRLLVAGGMEKVVRLFDVEGKTILRIFKGHTGSVHVAKFLSSGTEVLSASDDNSAIVWDIPSETEVIKYTQHNDYIRCGVTSQANKDIFLTGSYDHTVKLFDKRLADCVMSVDHGSPVESVLMFPTGGIFVSAGGNVVKVWDALAGGKLVTTLAHHHKTVTSLSFCSNYQRLLSGGLDRHVKIYDVSSYQVVHTLDYPGAILSLGVSPDDSLVAVGTAEGLLSLQKRKPSDVNLVKKKKKPVSFTYGLKGKTFVPNKDDHVIEHKKKETLAKYDKYFKSFEHTKALDVALDLRVRNMTPGVTVSVLQELIRRGTIRQAVAGREGPALKGLLTFLNRNISNPPYMATVIDVANIVLDIYQPQIGISSELDSLLSKLKMSVDKEMVYMKMLFEVMGAMDTLFSCSQSSTPSLTTDTPQVMQPSAAAVATS